MKRLPLALSVTAVVVALFGTTLVGHAAASTRYEPATGETYVPFVTDFPKPEPSGERYVPFVTDFPQVASPVSPARPAVAPADGNSAVEWREVGIVGGFAAALAALHAGSWLGLTRHAQTARH